VALSQSACAIDLPGGFAFPPEARAKGSRPVPEGLTQKNWLQKNLKGLFFAICHPGRLRVSGKFALIRAIRAEVLRQPVADSLLSREKVTSR
jgi:hypothetical protein